jgi:hypothetical protein
MLRSDLRARLVPPVRSPPRWAWSPRAGSARIVADVEHLAAASQSTRRRPLSRRTRLGRYEADGEGSLLGDEDGADDGADDGVDEGADEGASEPGAVVGASVGASVGSDGEAAGELQAAAARPIVRAIGIESRARRDTASPLIGCGRTTARVTGRSGRSVRCSARPYVATGCSGASCGAMSACRSVAGRAPGG